MMTIVNKEAKEKPPEGGLMRREKRMGGGLNVSPVKNVDDPSDDLGLV